MGNNLIPNRQNWLFKNSPIKDIDKDTLIDEYLGMMFAITSKMIKYNNLPETMNNRDMEYLIQSKGFGVGLKDKDNLYVLFGAFAGRLNEQYLPTKAIVTNPYLNLSKEYTIDKDCVIFKNDSSYMGLMTKALKYAQILAECDLSIKASIWNSRILNLVTASDDVTKKSADKFFENIKDGKYVGVILTKPLLDSLKTYPFNSSANNYITNLLELKQYYLANWFIEIGINDNYNMKRESLTADETSVNEYTLPPFIEDMLQCRKDACLKFNKMFGTNISVEFNSVWALQMQDLINRSKLLEKELNAPTEQFGRKNDENKRYE